MVSVNVPAASPVSYLLAKYDQHPIHLAWISAQQSLQRNSTGVVQSTPEVREGGISLGAGELADRPAQVQAHCRSILQWQDLLPSRASATGPLNGIAKCRVESQKRYTHR